MWSTAAAAAPAVFGLGALGGVAYEAVRVAPGFRYGEDRSYGLRALREAQGRLVDIGDVDEPTLAWARQEPEEVRRLANAGVVGPGLLLWAEGRELVKPLPRATATEGTR